MLVVRLMGSSMPIALCVMLGTIAVTKDRKWLRIFGRTLMISLSIHLIFIGICFFERFLLAV